MTMENRRALCTVSYVKPADEQCTQYFSPALPSVILT